MGLTLVTAPVYEPISVDEVKDHHRITITTEDPQILPWIKAAREIFENETGLKLISQTWDWKLDQFCPVLRLPFAPVSSITSITYIDTSGDSQTLSASLYQSDLVSEPARIMPAYGQVWPSTRSETFNAVTVRLVAGYATPVLVPKPIRLAVLQIVGDFYNHREESLDMQLYQVPRSAQRVIDSYKLNYFG